MGRGRKSNNGWSRNQDSGEDCRPDEFNYVYKTVVLPLLRRRCRGKDLLTIESCTYSESWFEWCRLIRSGVTSIFQLANYVKKRAVAVARDSLSEFRRMFGSETTKTKKIREVMGLPEGEEPVYQNYSKFFLANNYDDYSDADDGDLFECLSKKLEPTVRPMVKDKSNSFTAAWLCLVAIGEETRYRWERLSELGITHWKQRKKIVDTVHNIVKEHYGVFSG